MENLYNSMKGNLMGFRNEGEKLLKAARANAIKVEEDDRLVDEEENEAIPSFLAGPEEAKAVEVKRDQRRRMSTVPDFVRSGPGSSGSRAMPPPIAEMPSKQENPVTNKRK